MHVFTSLFRTSMQMTSLYIIINNNNNTTNNNVYAVQQKQT